MAATNMGRIIRAERRQTAIALAERSEGVNGRSG
jgi:hypothetical protein